MREKYKQGFGLSLNVYFVDILLSAGLWECLCFDFNLIISYLICIFFLLLSLQVSEGDNEMWRSYIATVILEN